MRWPRPRRRLERYPFAGMVVERSIDGTVRLPRSPYLAGSSLTMDAAVRNVVAWDLCSVDEAVAMASDHPLAAMAGAMRHHRIPMPAGQVTWGRDLRVADVRIDGRAYPVSG